MKIVVTTIRAGNKLVYKDELWVVTKQPEHVKPGKGPAYMQVEMKNLKTGSKLNERFNSSDYIERAQFEQKDYQYLYAEDENLVMMDMENFEQMHIPSSMLGNKRPLLQDNMVVKLEFYEEKPIGLGLPATVALEITETDPVIKGSTATSSYKPAILEGGVKTSVPPYLVAGEKIVIKTEDCSYVERCKV
jgi:elongation factor P